MTVTTQAGSDPNGAVLAQRNFMAPSSQGIGSNFANAGPGHQLGPTSGSNSSRDNDPYGQGYNPDSDPNVLRERDLEAQQAAQLHDQAARIGSRIHSSDSN